MVFNFYDLDQEQPAFIFNDCAPHYIIYYGNIPREITRMLFSISLLMYFNHFFDKLINFPKFIDF